MEFTVPCIYRTWLEQIRRERQAVLTITSLQLPECSVPLIESLANKCCRAPSARDAGKEETLNEILAKVAETKTRTLKQPRVNGEATEEPSEPVNENYEIENCRQENESPKGTSSEAPTYDDAASNNTDVYDIENDDTFYKSYDNVPIVRNNIVTNGSAARNQDCMCTEIPDNLRINIRKKTEVRRRSSVGGGGARSPSPEVTHTIRIAMKYHGQQQQQQDTLTTREQVGESENDDEERPSTSTSQKSSTCCPGVSVALDFTLNCNSVQLTSRDVTVRPITAQQQRGIKIKSAKD